MLALQHAPNKAARLICEQHPGIAESSGRVVALGGSPSRVLQLQSPVSLAVACRNRVRCERRRRRRAEHALLHHAGHFWQPLAGWVERSNAKLPRRRMCTVRRALDELQPEEHDARALLLTGVYI
jgi:hypothetical protein